MPVVRLEHQLHAPAELVWEVLTDPDVLSRRIAVLDRVEIVEGYGLGMRRYCHDIRERFWPETCTEWVEGERYTMQIDVSEFPYPFRNMKYTLGLKKLPGDAVLVHIKCAYTPKFGLLGSVLDWTWLKWKIEDCCEQLMESFDDEIAMLLARFRVTVGTILKGKGRDIVSIRPDITVEEAARVLHKKRIGAVLVIDAAGELAGLVSERDIVINIAEHGENVLQWPVEKIMTRKLHTCHPETGLNELMNVMTERRVRHLPVLDDGKLIGVISIGDVVKARISELLYDSESLKTYIAARKWREEHRHAPRGGVVPGN